MSEKSESEIEKPALYGPAPGRETPDARPLELPLGFKRPESLAEQVQRLVRTSVSQIAEAEGYETFEEANDFDIEDDQFEPDTPYEEDFDPVLGRSITPDELRRNPDEYREMFARAVKEMPRMELLDALGIDPDEHPGLPFGENQGGASQGAGAGAAERATGPLTGDGGETPSQSPDDST